MFITLLEAQDEHRRKRIQYGAGAAVGGALYHTGAHIRDTRLDERNETIWRKEAHERLKHDPKAHEQYFGKGGYKPLRASLPTMIKDSILGRQTHQEYFAKHGRELTTPPSLRIKRFGKGAAIGVGAVGAARFLKNKLSANQSVQRKRRR